MLDCVARLCLVNQAFCEAARPRLYCDLELGQDRPTSKFQLPTCIKTFDANPALGALVTQAFLTIGEHCDQASAITVLLGMPNLKQLLLTWTIAPEVPSDSPKLLAILPHLRFLWLSTSRGVQMGTVVLQSLFGELPDASKLVKLYMSLEWSDATCLASLAGRPIRELLAGEPEDTETEKAKLFPAMTSTADWLALCAATPNLRKLTIATPISGEALQEFPRQLIGGKGGGECVHFGKGIVIGAQLDVLVRDPEVRETLEGLYALPDVRPRVDAMWKDMDLGKEYMASTDPADATLQVFIYLLVMETRANADAYTGSCTVC